ncbi:sulfotransferase domain-containing protein [Kribbella amoyensis]|uniref:Sulfotransferase domain-containing protein n=1 Tax=Kribbella amoyensis TaxID=996641 RepID=A0A561BWM4_9ACTN|nr:sulfotransferase [Kribbella amoyensis]TWD83279.1 sulfotransferase domain-containing protein [Kribbella amoyensis]
MTSTGLTAKRTAVLRSTRDIVPDGTQEAIRKATRAVGRATSGVRMLPDFLVVGAQRCGTTTLYRLLVDHPAIVRPLFHKGIGYFDIGYDRPWSWYQGHFPVAAVAAARTRRTGAPMTFDSSGYYLFHPLAPERIAAHLPGVKIVVLVRDPVERAFSAYKHERARGFETEDFETALALEPARLSGEVERMREDPAYLSFHHRHHAYVGRGRYAEQIVRFQQALSPEQVFVIDANRFFDQPVEQFARLQEWLGLPVHHPAKVEQANARPSKPMPAGLRTELLAGFESSDAELTTILGTTPSWRL